MMLFGICKRRSCWYCMGDHAGKLACGDPLWTNLSLWYPAGDCWRSRGLEKDWEVRGGCAHGCAHAAGQTGSGVLGHKGLQWCSRPQRTSPWDVPGKKPLIHPWPFKGNLSSECVMQVNGIALVALESRVAGESLHYSRCFDK